MASTIEERTVLVQILEVYREYRCLWDTSDPAYHNKDIRHEAFTDLLSIYRQARPITTLKEFKKKLDNMRTTWKSEAKKVKDSVGTGGDSKAAYVPTLWYYELMLFLDDKECTRQENETQDDDIEIETNDDPEAVDEFPPTPPSMNNVTSQCQIKRRERLPLQKRQYKLIDDAYAVINTTDDDWDVIGMALGVQLKQLCSDQRIIAQKLISDTLFYGNLKKLTVTSSVTLYPVTQTPIQGYITTHSPLVAGSSSHFAPRYVPYLSTTPCSRPTASSSGNKTINLSSSLSRPSQQFRIIQEAGDTMANAAYVEPTPQPAPVLVLKMPSHEKTIQSIIKCINFCAIKHKNQRRKDPEGTPYINHPIGVAEILSNEAGITDLNVIMAALLHDTVEDTDTTFEEIEQLFGAKVKNIVDEVTDDKSLPKLTRKQLQIEHAPGCSTEAKLVKLADKLYNLRDLKRSTPDGWNEQRVKEYFQWASKVIDGLRGTNKQMEDELDKVLEHK